MEWNMAFVISYDGSRYVGFQTQEGLPTIQETLTKAIERIVDHPVTVHASGRTDAGVHANGQVVHFLTTRNLPEHRWPLAVNSMMPEDIRVRKAILVSHDFHARISAKRKTYRYEVHTSPVLNVLLRHMQYHFPRKINFEIMLRAAQELVGTHDFRGFCVTKSLKENNIRTIYELNISRHGDCILFEVTGNGFLHNMVRIIVGTLLSLAEGKISYAQFIDLLANGKRPQIVATVPAHGLQLWSVTYDEFCSE